MKEESVFWLGGRPGTQQSAQGPPDAARLEPAIRAACRALGIEPGSFVAALGGHGSWLVEFSRNGAYARVVWNGRERLLVLQAALRTGGWADLRDCAVASPDEAGFVAGIGKLLREEIHAAD